MQLSKALGVLIDSNGNLSGSHLQHNSRSHNGKVHIFIVRPLTYLTSLTSSILLLSDETLG